MGEHRVGDDVAGATRWHVVAAIALGAALLAVLLFGVETRDDAYATYWVAEQLVRSGRLANVNGARLEQSSSLAMVLLLAALYAVTRAPLPVLAYGVGLASLAATVCLGAVLARRIRPRTEVATAVVLALAFPLLFWSTGGLETLLAAAGTLWFVLTLGALVAAPPRVGTVVPYVGSTLVVVTVRPDTMLWATGVVLVVVFVAALRTRVELVARSTPAVATRSALLSVVLLLVAVLALGAVRLATFGTLLPQPDLAKTGGLAWLSTGVGYVVDALPWWLWLPLLALVVAGAWWGVAARCLAGLLAVLGFVVGVVGVAFTRGDWMGAARLLVPYLAFGLVTATVGATTLPRAWRRAALGTLVAVECVALVLVANGAGWVSSAYQSPYGPSAASATEAAVGAPFGGTLTAIVGATPPVMPWYTAWDFVTARDTEFLATATPVLRRLLATHPGPVTIASTQAGMVVDAWELRFPGRLDFIDLDDVVTDDFDRCAGLHESYGGDVMTFARWARDAGRCAPPLPDLVFGLGAPGTVPGLATRFHVVSLASVLYREHHLLGATTVLGATEYLAARDGWRLAR